MEPVAQDSPEAKAAAVAAPAGASYSVDRTLELPMRLLGRTVKRTSDALTAMAPGEVLAVHTDDP